MSETAPDTSPDSSNELLARMSPLARAAGNGDDARPAVTVREVRGLAIVEIAAYRGCDEALRDALAGLSGAAPLSGADTESADLRMLSTGPGRWLLLGTRDALDRAGSALPENIAACTDLSHGRTVLRLEGRGAPLLLSKGCPIDTHAKAFPTGSVAATGIERVPVLLARIDDRPSFELVLPRSYARAIFEWIMVSGHDLDLRAGLPLATA